jgi:hypothetical protein
MSGKTQPAQPLNLKAALKRHSTLATLIGIGIAFLSLILALGPLFEWRPPSRFEICAGVASWLFFLITIVLGAFFQQLEVEHALKDALADEIRTTRGEIAAVTSIVDQFLPLKELVQTDVVCAAGLASAAGNLHRALTEYKDDRLIVKHGREMIKKTADRSKELMNGQFETSFWWCHILQDELELMEEALLGYSPLLKPAELEWWSSPRGVAFFELNKRVLSNGSKKTITRIFCCDEKDPAVQQILKSHCDAHVTIRIANPDNAKRFLEIPDESMAVVDKRVAYYSASGRSKNVWICNPDLVQRQWNKLNTLMENSKPYRSAQA